MSPAKLPQRTSNEPSTAGGRELEARSPPPCSFSSLLSLQKNPNSPTRVRDDREIYMRWIGKFEQKQVQALFNLKQALKEKHYDKT